jgi:hypothetical protein
MNVSSKGWLNVGDLLSAASLLLTVVGVIYGVWYTEISVAVDDGAKLPPRNHPEDRAAPLRRLRRVLLSKAIPLAIASLCVAVVYLPPSLCLVVQFIHGCLIQGPAILLHYDPIGTSFIVVEFFSISLACLSSARASALWKLTRK